MDAWPVTRVTDVTRIPTFNDYDIKQSLLNRVVKIVIGAAMVQGLCFVQKSIHVEKCVTRVTPVTWKALQGRPQMSAFIETRRQPIRMQK